MSEAAIREQMAVILGAVEGIGVVHQYQRWAATWEKFLDLFKDPDGVINGWCITRTSTTEHWITNIKYERVLEFVIRGYYGVNDAKASEISFQQIIEDICEAFRCNDTLNGTCETIAPQFGPLNGMAGVQVRIVDARFFGGVLCHFCELAIGIQITGLRS